MKTGWQFRARASLAGLIILSGCSGGSSMLTPISSQPGATSAAGSTSVGKITGKLVIPKSTKAVLAALRARKAGASSRKPDYVSSDTYGVAIVTSSGGSVIASTAFAADSSNPNCSQDPNTGNEDCLFSIGADAPSTDFAVSAYDEEPSSATGAAGSVEPSDATLLSTATANGVAITAGASTNVAISLGGVVAYVQYDVTNANQLLNPDPISTSGSSSARTRRGSAISTDHSAAPNLRSVLADGQPTTLLVTYQAYDGDGDQIAASASDPLANPITLTVSENNPPANGTFTTVANGSGTASNSAASSNTSDTFDVVYNGQSTGTSNATAYSASISASAGAATDAASGASSGGGPSTNYTFTIDPLAISATTQRSDSFSQQGAVASLTYGNPQGVTPSAIELVQPFSTADYSESGTAYASNACTGFGLDPSSNFYPGTEMAYDAIFTQSPVNAQPCSFTISDGTSSYLVNLTAAATNGSGTITIPSKISVSPASPFQYSCESGSCSASTPISISDAASSTPSYTITACTANNAVTGCGAHGGTATSCGNGSGTVTLDLANGAITTSDINSGFSSSTGPIDCSVTIADGLGNSLLYELVMNSSAGPQPGAHTRAGKLSHV